MLSQEAAAQVKQHGKSNDMVERILDSPYFAPIHGKLKQLLDPVTFIGRAPQQVCYLFVWRCMHTSVIALVRIPVRFTGGQVSC